MMTIWQWIKLPWQRSFVGMLIMALLMIGAGVLLALAPKAKMVWAALAIHGYALMFAALLSAMVYTSICRPESQLLPGFRRSLRHAMTLQALLLIGIPAALAQWLGASGFIAGGALFMAAAFGLASGTGAKWAILFWLVPVVLGIWPEFRAQVVAALRDSPVAPLLLYAFAALVVRLTWQRLMAIRDGAPTLSPADVSPTDMRYGVEALQAQQAGKFGKWLRGLQQRFSSIAFESALRRVERSRSVDHALQLMMLPNLHWRGLLLEILTTAVFLGIMLLVINAQPGKGPPPSMLASYVGLLTAIRFQQLHRAMLLIRPSLVDAYFTLGPASAREYAGLVARNLWRSVPAAVLFGMVLMAGACVLIAPAQRPEAMLGAIFGTTASALIGLGYVWMTLDVARAFNLAGVMILGIAGSVSCSLAVAATIAHPIAGLMTGGFLVAFGFGFALRGYRNVQRFALNFDAPI